MRVASLFAVASAYLAAAAPSVSKRDSCTITSTSAISAAISSCSTITISTLEVPAGETLDLTDLNDGTNGPLISISGTSITITGASGHLLNGGGEQWWDGKGSNGGVTKPKFFYAHSLKQSTITGLNVKNTPVQGFSVNSANDLTITDVTIDNSDGDDNGGHNTDAFDVGSSDGVTIDGAKVYNQDDCLAVNSGTNIVFKNGYCSGGHGVSIGSVGGRSDNTVDTVTISDTTITKSDNGVRIKTVYDATGEVKGVTYSGITLSEIAKYGIVIEQDYENGSPTGTPTAGVPITDLTIENVTGSVSDGAVEVYILCASCSDWTWSGVSITGGEVSDKCEGVPTGASC
ncbi:glycoside hydrolase [Geopyxis carbonaria]|nr:glycoside hydrolase [Geopyxis carbonaria]